MFNLTLGSMCNTADTQFLFYIFFFKNISKRQSVIILVKEYIYEQSTNFEFLKYIHVDGNVC